jgi:thymidylate synthase (FAD)
MQPTAKLIAHTVPVDPASGRSLEEFVGYCARVSNPGNQGAHDSSGRLLKYLADNAHWSPFEMAQAVVEITTTRDIARQILRHRSFSFQEFSQRYGHAMNFHEGRPLRWQDTKNRQNSITPDLSDLATAALAEEWLTRQRAVIELARNNYEWALRQGVAKEVARSVLPEGLTISKLYVSGSLRSWIHYVQLRTDSSTQLEHREVADLCALALRRVTPVIDIFTRNAPKTGEDQRKQHTTHVKDAKFFLARQLKAKPDEIQLEECWYEAGETTVSLMHLPTRNMFKIIVTGDNENMTCTLV